MTLVLLPDAERLVSNFLRAQAEIVALVGDKVYTELPASPAWPVVRITRIGGSPVTVHPLHLDSPRLQIEAFGGTKNKTVQIAETCRAVIDQRITGVHAEGVVTGANWGPFVYSPDSTFSPAKPRSLFTVILFTHP